MSDLERTGRRLQTATIAWNLIEVFITITLGLLWHMSDATTVRRDRRARRLVAAAFTLLALYLAAAGTRALLTGAEPESSPLGIAYLALTAIVMFSLATWKTRIGRQLSSEPFLAEARMTYLDGWLAAAILTALALNTIAGWWWADPAAALIVAIAAAREAHELATKPEASTPAIK